MRQCSTSGKPPRTAALHEVLAALEGTLATLSPGLDLVTAARARGRDLLADQFSPEQAEAASPTSWSRCCRWCSGCRGGWGRSPTSWSADASV